MLALLSLVFIFVLTSAQEELLVTLPEGKVQGTTLTTASGKEIYVWRGIPYVKAPIGQGRFETPWLTPDTWKEIIDGSNDSKACLFVGSYEGDPVPTNGYSEDCLFINVYAPQKPDPKNKLSVMFWIYGGGFNVGSGDFAFTDPTPFLEEGVIVVTFNYRLSVFGFLSTGDGVLAGNAGLKDQFAALMWTNKYIARFGGEAKDITLFGESAGAASVSHHLISPLSRNLFQAAILQSGTSLLDLFQKNPRNNALALASLVDSSITANSTSKDIANVLKQADAQLLANLTLTHGLDFKPVLEPDNIFPFLTEPFYEAIETGNIFRVPIIIGTNSEEEILAIKDIASGLEIAKYYDENPDLLLPNFNVKEGVDVETITREIKQMYVGNGTFTDDLGALVRWMSDNKFVRPAIKHAALQSKYTPVYFYRFSFVGSRSEYHPYIPGCGRVGHAEDVPYLFNISTKPITTNADYLTRRRLVKLWTNFVKTKNPTPGDDSAELLQNVTWERFDQHALQYLEIGDNLEPKLNLEHDMTAFWNHLWETYSYRPYNTF